MGIEEIVCDAVDCFRDVQWRALMDTVMNFRLS
jgi:hypothetical protein